jgi:hypothetical protein
MEETGKEEEDIDRVECWKKAREKKPKQGGGYDPAVESVIKKIVSIQIKQVLFWYVLVSFLS